MIKRPSHPSGRPIRRERIVGPSIWRIPDRGSIIPRMQDNPERTEAIGFVTDFGRESDGEET